MADEVEKFIRHKLYYIYNNPVSGKLKLAEFHLDYKNSNARIYACPDVARIWVRNQMAVIFTLPKLFQQ